MTEWNIDDELSKIEIVVSRTKWNTLSIWYKLVINILATIFPKVVTLEIKEG